MMETMSTETADSNLKEYVTAMIGGQLFGLPIRGVQDVFTPERVTRVPLAPPEIAGVFRLEGQLLMMIDIDRVLDIGGKAIAA